MQRPPRFDQVALRVAALRQTLDPAAPAPAGDGSAP